MKIIKLTKQVLYLLFISIILISCGNDDSGETTDDSQALLNENREATTLILSDGDQKTWRIVEASLTNISGTFNISTNYNIIDDEFIFNSNKSIIWRPGFGINSEGKNSNETLLGYYRSPNQSTFNYKEDSSTVLTTMDGSFVFEVINNFTITGTLYFTENNTESELTLTLTNKGLLDYASAPENGLNFTKVFTFNSNGISSHAPGMLGSYYDNSLFLATRETTSPIPLAPSSEKIVNGPERIIKWNLETKDVTEITYYSDDFVSKQMHIVNNELVVIGGHQVTKYPLDLSESINSTVHGKALSRFGMAVSDNNAYIIGGELIWDVDHYTGGDKIYKWDVLNQSLETISNLPENRYGARGTIINDILYIFGGTDEFGNYLAVPKNTIYIYDINSGSFSTEEMTTSAFYTYVDRFQNLIYVTGQKAIFDNDNTVINYETILGVYNTLDNTYQDVSHNLDTTNFKTIQGMCVFNNKMYVIFGFGENTDNPEWSIMAADIN